MNTWKQNLALPITLSALALVAASPLCAANFEVTNLNDSGAGSLRQAIIDANANPDEDTINIKVNGTLKLTGGQMAINTPMNIIGPGSDKFTIEVSATNSRAFSAFPLGQGTITCPDTLAGPIYKWSLSGMKITGGNRVDGNSSGAIFTWYSFEGKDLWLTGNSARVAGAISASIRYKDQSFVIKNSLIENNQALYVSTDTRGSSGAGIGIYEACSGTYLASSALIENTIIRNNTINNTVTGSTGAGLYVDSFGTAVQVIDSQITGNQITLPSTLATSGYVGGGAYFQSAFVLLGNVEVSNNIARTGGGLFLNNSLADKQQAGNTLAFLVNATVSDNLVAGYTGGVNFNGNINAFIHNSTLYNNTKAYDAVSTQSKGTISLGKGSYVSNGVTTSTLEPKLTIDSSIVWGEKTGATANVTGINFDAASYPTAPAPLNGVGNFVQNFNNGGSFVSANNATGLDPKLLPLAVYNHGFLRTNPPTPNSPVIGKGNVSLDGLTVDQVGNPRTVNGKTDTGAYQTKALVDVIEFYNTPLNHYFVTASPEEAKGIDSGAAGAGWSRTGKAWKSWALKEPGTAPVCRFYAFTANSHFYTGDKAECKALADINPKGERALGWILEGDVYGIVSPIATSAGVTCDDGYKPLYRAYNRAYEIAGKTDSNHRYTTDMAVIAEMVGKGWKDEKTVMCVK